MILLVLATRCDEFNILRNTSYKTVYEAYRISLILIILQDNLTLFCAGQSIRVSNHRLIAHIIFNIFNIIHPFKYNSFIGESKWHNHTTNTHALRVLKKRSSMKKRIQSARTPQRLLLAVENAKKIFANAARTVERKLLTPGHKQRSQAHFKTTTE